MTDQDKRNLNKWKSDLYSITSVKKVIHNHTEIVYNSPLGKLVKTVEGYWRWQKPVK